MALIKNAKVMSKGQVTIPAEVRSAAKLREGDTLSFEVSDEGCITLRPVREERAFARYAGALADDSGRTSETVTADLRKRRGWSPQ